MTKIVTGIQSQSKIVTGSKIGIIAEDGELVTAYVTKTWRGDDGLLFVGPTDAVNEDGDCEGIFTPEEVVSIAEQPYKFFYSDCLDALNLGRLTVAYRVTAEGVNFKYAKCNPKDRFEKIAGRFYSMNAEEVHYLDAEHLVGGFIKEPENFDCNLLTNHVILTHIEDYIFCYEVLESGAY